MTPITSLEDAQDAVRNNPVTLLYFSQHNCGVCDAMRPKVEAMVAERPRMAAYEINASESPEAAAQYNIFTIPGILIFILGKETVREARYVSLELLEERIDRYLEILPDHSSPAAG